VQIYREPFKSKCCKRQFQTGNERIFHAVTQAPIAAQTDALSFAKHVCGTQGLKRFGITPSVHFCVRWRGANARDFRKCFEQFGLNAIGCIF
jgi:hypothetical protein